MRSERQMHFLLIEAPSVERAELQILERLTPAKRRTLHRRDTYVSAAFVCLCCCASAQHESVYCWHRSEDSSSCWARRVSACRHLWRVMMSRTWVNEMPYLLASSVDAVPLAASWRIATTSLGVSTEVTGTCPRLKLPLLAALVGLASCT